MPLKDILSCYYWRGYQPELYVAVEETVGSPSDRYRLLLDVFEFVRVGKLIGSGFGPGRPAKDRVSLAHAFLAKGVFDLPSTRDLIERLEVDEKIRRLCGWSSARAIPGEATFSRAFAEFAESSLPARLHEALVERTLGEHLVGHISWDSTAIEAREKPAAKAPKPRRKRGRPRTGEERAKEPSVLERQQNMELCEMLHGLPEARDVGSKRYAKGHATFWTGYKLHLDVGDGGIPVRCILTSASVHDSQAAIPLATMTSQRVCSLYHVMDSAHDAQESGPIAFLSGMCRSSTRTLAVRRNANRRRSGRRRPGARSATHFRRHSAMPSALPWNG